MRNGASFVTRFGAASLLGLGAFLITMAFLLKFYAYGQLAVVPLDLNTKQVAVDKNAVFFDADNVKANVRGTLTTTASVIANKDDSIKASDEYGRKLVVLHMGRMTDNNGVKPPMDASTERVAIDRTTGEAFNCCSENYNDVPVKHDGLIIKFPFDVQKKDYMWWDSTSKKSFPAKFVKETEVKGMKVYEFTQTVPEIVFRKQEIPDYVFNPGSQAAAVNANRTYQNVRTFWVDPNTGVMMDYEENQKQFLVDPATNKRIIAVQTASSFNDATIQNNIDTYKTKGALLAGLRGTVPMVLWLLGGLSLLAGVLLSVRGRTSQVGHGSGGVREEFDTRTDGTAWREHSTEADGRGLGRDSLGDLPTSSLRAEAGERFGELPPETRS